jgi:hypothetical protein
MIVETGQDAKSRRLLATTSPASAKQSTCSVSWVRWRLDLCIGFDRHQPGLGGKWQTKPVVRGVRTSFTYGSAKMVAVRSTVTHAGSWCETAVRLKLHRRYSRFHYYASGSHLCPHRPYTTWTTRMCGCHGSEDRHSFSAETTYCQPSTFYRRWSRIRRTCKESWKRHTSARCYKLR